jgi:hypothetical protein
MHRSCPAHKTFIAMDPDPRAAKGYDGTLMILSLGELFAQEIFVFNFDDALAMKLHTAIEGCPHPARRFMMRPLGESLPSTPSSDLDIRRESFARAGYSWHMGVSPPPSPLEDEDPKIQSFLQAMASQAMSLGFIGHQRKTFADSTWLAEALGFDLNSLDWLIATAESHQIGLGTEAVQGSSRAAMRI